MKKYPHINILYKDQLRNILNSSNQIKEEIAQPIFTDTFPGCTKPLWMTLNCTVWNESIERKRRSPSQLYIEPLSKKCKTEMTKGKDDYCNIEINTVQEKNENVNSEGDNAKSGFIRANQLLPKKLQQRNNESKENEEAKTLTEDKNGKRKFVPPYANPGKRIEYGDISSAVSKPKRKEQDEEKSKGENDKLIEQIESEILDSSPCVHWEEIVGLDYAKKTIEEILILPISNPELRELINFPHGILLFGPPGTGKTMIAKAIATQCQSTFFNISASILTSKWMGESEKLVKVLFDVAKERQPSIIFIDEIDSLLCARSENDFESSRRIKTEFLVKMEGVANGASHDDQVIIIGATNRPQELDEAVKRRLAKRLYIPLPNKIGRIDFFVKALSRSKLGHTISNEQIEQLAIVTKGYSGADLKALVSEAAMYPVRSVLGQKNISIKDIRKISYEDFVAALGMVKATVSKDDLGKYLEWNQMFGSYPFSEADLDN